MKPIVLLPIVLVFLLVGSSVVTGQDRNEKKIDRLQRKIEKQSKKLQELSGGQYHAFAMIAPPMNEKDIEKIKEMKEMEVRVFNDSKGKNYRYYYKTPKYQFKGGDPVVIDIPDVNVDIPEIKGGVYHFYSGSQDNLSINKDLTDESSTADFNYEVKEGSGGMSVNVNGAIDSGKVVITIKRPDGEVYNEYTLSSLANVKWNQAIKFEDQEESQYLGKWTVTVAAEKAKGNYSVQLSGR